MGYFFIFLYLLFVALVIEIASTLLVYTGLEPEISRYQVISMLTGTGFTTDESKLIIDHPLRRKISAFLILFGAFSLAVIISSISNILSDNFQTTELTVICSILILLLFLLKLPIIKQTFSKKLKEETKDTYPLSELPIKDVLYFEDDDYVTSIHIQGDSPFVGQKIESLIKPGEDLHVLSLIRGNRPLRENLNKKELQDGDRVIVYGKEEIINAKFGEEN
ncbi:TrkA C-terminal domain-containing protein [Fictibacillus terranigra]|uniref:TrkA C-terminal domain-containing protein n=1 Tax=Fictibacillus terranigra TaxID=3058424 RepID=A0ABT8E1P2_9BACL|nr:TrkA C-terminal domain-containing protein [Fictibacillus sp. CENA-BCM004]MDN4071820.1 TrkA C-terminal domain-containing protein [Fictibacillus sp. CENA-BCM004]